ncbi:hypothetical protein G2W53_010137 [Senna tora]|uniref:HAT C-terminal dimerisation domain-containing protein n=1 Tax=Senna tora TaxID=362788 RepID=A0A834WZL3_9FABA|nr:hypothetical protein G2W53_010137 [Senna tora]
MIHTSTRSKPPSRSRSTPATVVFCLPPLKLGPPSSSPPLAEYEPMATSEQQSTVSTPSTQSIRSRADPAWEYCIEMTDPNGKKIWKCITTPGAQPSIKYAMAGKEAMRRANMAIARFFYDNCIPMNVANSVYYQPMIDAIASIGSGYKGPTYQALRTNVLHDMKKEVTLLLEACRSSCSPNVQKLAIRLLSQTTSSSSCERNWSVFERIHTKKMNRLEHKRLNDLVYIHYHLRLKNCDAYKRRNCDPIDYESIENIEFWIIDKDTSPFLDYDELENMIYDEQAVPIIAIEEDNAHQNNNPQPRQGEHNLDSFPQEHPFFIDPSTWEHSQDNDYVDSDLPRSM